MDKFIVLKYRNIRGKSLVVLRCKSCKFKFEVTHKKNSGKERMTYCPICGCKGEF